VFDKDIKKAKMTVENEKSIAFRLFKYFFKVGAPLANQSTLFII